MMTSLAGQTPVFQRKFMEDSTTKWMLQNPMMGRHKTETWEDGADTRFWDKVEIQQPNLLAPYKRRDSAECEDTCVLPKSFVAHGTTRDSWFMEQKIVKTQPWCYNQLRGIPHVSDQMEIIFRYLKGMPELFMGDYIQTRMVSFHDTLEIAGNAFDTFAITNQYTSATPNTDVNLSTINLGAAANLPTSDLTLDYLDALGDDLEANGYFADSGLPAGMFNLVLHSRDYRNLVGGNPEVRSQLRLDSVPGVSALYKRGMGINAEPFGPWAPTFNPNQVRFQHVGNGLLERVQPYDNVTTSTGARAEQNTNWRDARYAISYITHPMAATLFTPSPQAIMDGVPTVNSSMWGSWFFKNPDGMIQWDNTDGTTCTENNELGWWFYWLLLLEMGWKYEERRLLKPILHLRQAGRDCVVNKPVCGEAPQYDPNDGVESVWENCET
jgi:hypothetical protein